MQKDEGEIKSLIANNNQKNWRGVVRIFEAMPSDAAARAGVCIVAARAYARIGQESKALAVLTDAVARFPNNSAVALAQIEVAQPVCTSQEVSALCDAVAERFQNNPQVLSSVARQYVQVGSMDRAIMLLDRAISNGAGANSHCILVQCLGAQANWTRVLDEGLRLQNCCGDAGCRRALAEAAFHRAQHEIAIGAMIAYLRANIRRSINDYDLAADIYISSLPHAEDLKRPRSDLLTFLVNQPEECRQISEVQALAQKLQRISVLSAAELRRHVPHLESGLTQCEITSRNANRFRFLLGLDADGPSWAEMEDLLTGLAPSSFCRFFSNRPIHAGNVNGLITWLELIDDQHASRLSVGFGPLNLTLFHRGMEVEERWRIERAVLLAGGNPAPVKIIRSKGNLHGHNRLRLAICVSGQLRGFEQAVQTWSNLGLEDLDVDTFVHSWTNIGRKYPIQAHARRCFSGRFLDVYRQSFQRHDIKTLETYYPRLFAAFNAASIVSEDDVQRIYNAQKVVLEDDSDFPFSSFSNPKKMYYKIQRCWDLVRDSGKEYDLVLRLRPDLRIPKSASIDWRTVLQICSENKLIFSDRPFSINIAASLYMGDQFAVSTPEAMALYCSTYERILDPEDSVREYINVFKAHSTLAFSVYSAGYDLHRFDQVKPGDLLDPKMLSPEEILSLIKGDIAARQPFDLDRSWTTALEQDLSVK